MSRHEVAIEGAEEVWPAIQFDDYLSALECAIHLAKGFQGIAGAPRVGIFGESGIGYQDIDWYLTMEMMVGYVCDRPELDKP